MTFMLFLKLNKIDFWQDNYKRLFKMMGQFIPGGSLLMTTINDIAQKADVAKSTVSKVINNYEGVNEETRKHILKIMKENNFWPNATARSLSTNKSNIIGIFTASSLNDQFFREVLEGIEEIMGRAGYDLYYFLGGPWNISEKSNINYSFVEKSRDRNVDGVILLSYLIEDDQHFKAILESRIPTVFIDLDLEGNNTSYVMSDNTQGVKQAVKYLYDLGHRKIGYIDGLDNSRPAFFRFSGFKKIMKEKKLELQKNWIYRSEYTAQKGFQAMESILKLEKQPSAFLIQDNMAIGALQAVNKAGYNVPGDFSVIGFDDIELSAHYDLTTIRQNKFSMGEAASKQLLKIINGQKYQPLQIKTKLVARGSCREFD